MARSNGKWFSHGVKEAEVKGLQVQPAQILKPPLIVLNGELGFSLKLFLPYDENREVECNDIPIADLGPLMRLTKCKLHFHLKDKLIDAYLDGGEVRCLSVNERFAGVRVQSED